MITKVKVGDKVRATREGERRWKPFIQEGARYEVVEVTKNGAVLVLNPRGWPRARLGPDLYFGLFPGEFEKVTEEVTAQAPAKAPKKPREFDPQSQAGAILSHLLAGNTLTALTAMGVFGVFRLAARIKELRAAGHKIITTIKKDARGKPYAEYSLRKVSRFES